MSTHSIPPSLLPYLTGQKTDYSTLQPSIIRVNAIIIVLSCLAVTLRFWVRFGVLRAPGLDDLLLAIAVVFSMLLSTSCLVGRSFGLGKHIWNLGHSLADIPIATGEVTKSLYGCYLAYSTAITFTKLSIVATCLRIFPGGGLRKVVWGVGVISWCLWICSIFAIVFTCRPVRAAWDYTVEGKCIQVVNFFYVSSAFNIATDLILCFLPLPTLWALSMPKPQRVVLCVLFSMGTFACVASMLRMAQLHNLIGPDISYESVGSLNWSVIEVGTAIMCASLSTLRPLATRLLPKIFTNVSNFNTSNHSRSKHIHTPHADKIQSRNRQPHFSHLRNVKFQSESTDSSHKANGGQILVQQSFELNIVNTLPPAAMKDKNDRKGSGRTLSQLSGLSNGTSEEELVESRGGGGEHGW